MRNVAVDEVGHLRIFVHDAADAVADVLLDHAEAGRLGMLLHAQATSDHHLRRPISTMAIVKHLFADLDQAPPLRPDFADRHGDGRVGAPAVELAGRVDLDQVAFADHARAGDAVHHLLVERNAGSRGERHLARDSP